MARRGRARRTRQKGQSLVELAIFLPVILLLLLGVGDLARAFATMIVIESGAREAADWGAYRPGNWDAVVPQYPITVSEMERRACTTALELPDYAGEPDGSTCTNPRFECFVDATGDPSTPCSVPSACDVVACRVKVRLTYAFNLIFPDPFQLLPSPITFERASIFAVGKDPGGTP